MDRSELVLLLGCPMDPRLGWQTAQRAKARIGVYHLQPYIVLIPFGTTHASITLQGEFSMNEDENARGARRYVAPGHPQTLLCHRGSGS